jgi:hypothetical protein
LASGHFLSFAAAEEVENSLTRPLELGFDEADGSIEGQGRNSTDGDPIVADRDLRSWLLRPDNQYAIRGHIFFNVS